MICIAPTSQADTSLIASVRGQCGEGQVTDMSTDYHHEHQRNGNSKCRRFAAPYLLFHNLKHNG